MLVIENGKVYHEYADGQRLSPTDPADLTEILKRSIEHEKEKREPQVCNFGVDVPKKKLVRTSWKTEYESVFKIKEKYRVQRNLAIALAACYMLVDLIFKIFS